MFLNASSSPSLKRSVSGRGARSCFYTLKKMLVPEPPSDPQCTAAVPTELARVKWSVIVAPLKSSIALPFTMLAEVMLPGWTSPRSRTLVGAPVVLTFILPMTPFVSKDCRAVAVPRRSVPLSLERKLNRTGLLTCPGGGRSELDGAQ